MYQVPLLIAVGAALSALLNCIVKSPPSHTTVFTTGIGGRSNLHKALAQRTVAFSRLLRELV